MKNERDLSSRYPNAHARNVADEAFLKASEENPDITLAECCALWNDTYHAEVAKRGGAK